MIRILFAHPDQKLSQIYTRHLQDHFLVDSASDGLTALRNLKLMRPAMVVSEYHLPRLSGLSLLRFIRGNPDFWMTPFAFLSNHPDNSQALSGGANDWLDARSTHPDYLLDRIFHHLKTNKHAIQVY